MKKYLTLTLALLMVLVSFGNVGFALQKSDPVHQSRMAYVSPGIIAQMDEGSIDDPIDAWGGHQHRKPTQWRGWASMKAS